MNYRGPTSPPLNELKDYWLNRLGIATERHKMAAASYRDALQVYRDKHMPSPDGDVAFRDALRKENAARAEYLRVLQIFTELILEGKVPDDTH